MVSLKAEHAISTGLMVVAAKDRIAADLDDECCARFGVRFHEGRYQVPHVETFRRAFAGVDPEALDRVIGAWLTEHLPGEALRAIAIDGKTLRGAWNEHGRQVHLLAAMTHDEGAVVTQAEVPTDKTNEITMVRDLLGGLDLTGVVITADALHAQRDHAELIAGEADGDYLFTVKADQPTQDPWQASRQKQAAYGCGLRSRSQQIRRKACRPLLRVPFGGQSEHVVSTATNESLRLVA